MTAAVRFCGWEDDEDRAAAPTPRNSAMSTYIQMRSTIVGSGILTFPSMMQRISLVASNS